MIIVKMLLDNIQRDGEMFTMQSSFDFTVNWLTLKIIIVSYANQ